MVRFDHNFGVNDKFYGMWSFQDGYEYRANFPKPAQRRGTWTTSARSTTSS
jgi:hypothetical protein